MLISRSPLRVSFLGGGSDYPEHYLKYSGAVLGFAISESTYVSGIQIEPELAGHNFKISYREVEEVQAISGIAHAPFRHALEKIAIEPAWEFSVSANLPALRASRGGVSASGDFTLSGVKSAWKTRKQTRC